MVVMPKNIECGNCGISVEKIPKMLWNTLGNIYVCYVFILPRLLLFLIHSPLFHFVIEGFAVDGKQLGCFTLIAIGGFKSCFDALLFRLFVV